MGCWVLWGVSEDAVPRLAFLEDLLETFRLALRLALSMQARCLGLDQAFWASFIVFAVVSNSWRGSIGWCLGGWG